VRSFDPDLEAASPTVSPENEREGRDLPWGEYRVTVVIELYRVNCPGCGVKAEAEKVELVPSKAPFSLQPTVRRGGRAGL
jgi:hypothetical protein